MRMTVSRESDQFMAGGPRPDWRPHPSASWDKNLENWTIEVTTVENLFAVGDRIMVTNAEVPHVQINDI